MTHRVFLFAVMCVVTASASAAQQQPSLGDLARQVEASRAEKKSKAVRTYTNSDLANIPVLPPPPPAPAPAPGEAAGKTPAKDAPAPGTAKPAAEQAKEAPRADVVSEETWRRRASRLRDQVQALQVRLTRLTSRPPNTNATLQQRDDKEIAGIRADFPQLRIQWAALEQEARAAKISLSWIEPAPQFPQ